MEDSLPEDATSDGIHFDRPRGTEWLNGVFQNHINFHESDLVETGQFIFVPTPIPPFNSARSVTERLGEGSTREGAQLAAEADSSDRHLWKETRQNLLRPRARLCRQW